MTEIYEHKDLDSESDIESHFMDYGDELLDCGQGYYEDEIVTFAKIDNKYYQVSITAEIESAKQEYGDRLYWVSDITSVKWEEVRPSFALKKLRDALQSDVDDAQKTLDRAISALQEFDNEH